MVKLTKETRDGLPDDDFAVPGKRALPIHDAGHVHMAWDMVSKTKDLTAADRKEARRRIIERAKTLGIKTEQWERGRLNASMKLSAMALNISDDEHPNKMPFTGVLTRIDLPSDAAPEGSGGKRITISAEAAKKALSSLLGMAVNYTPNFDGHDPKAKVGVITAATIERDEIQVGGFVYKADFPEVAAEIKANKDKLGMSYEARNLYTSDPDANPVVIVECMFTGAAILLKDRAAYRTTSISASEEQDMTPEQEKLLKDAATGLAALTAGMASIAASVEALKIPKVEANAHTIALVEPHAKALESAADAMCAAGIGADAQNGHAVMLRKMAGNMRASAAMGHVPSAINRYDYSNASAETAPDKSAELAAKLEGMMKPLTDQIGVLGTKLADIQAAATKTVEQPVRKTLSPAITALLAKGGLTAPEKDGEKFSIAKIDEAFKEMSVERRLEAKTGLRQAGLID